MTAHALVGDQERCLASGMDGYFSKPSRTSELFATIERMLGDKPKPESADLAKSPWPLIRSELCRAPLVPDSQLSRFVSHRHVANWHPSTPQHHSSPHSFVGSLRWYNQTPCFSHLKVFTPGSSAGFIWWGIPINVKYPLARS
jgi:hypothetical protein